MVCPHCQSPRLRNLNRRTELGYAVFRCGGCRRKCKERTGTPFNYLELPTDIVFEVVLCRLRYKLSLRNLAEMFLLRGFEFTHEAVRDWEERFAPLLAEQIRRKRKGKVGRRWYVDETALLQLRTRFDSAGYDHNATNISKRPPVCDAKWTLAGLTRCGSVARPQSLRGRHLSGSHLFGLPHWRPVEHDGARY